MDEENNNSSDNSSYYTKKGSVDYSNNSSSEVSCKEEYFKKDNNNDSDSDKDPHNDKDSNRSKLNQNNSILSNQKDKNSNVRLDKNSKKKDCEESYNILTINKYDDKYFLSNDYNIFKDIDIKVKSNDSKLYVFGLKEDLNLLNFKMKHLNISKEFNYSTIDFKLKLHKNHLNSYLLKKRIIYNK